MIAVDTNILVYAHRSDSPHHASALSSIEELAEGVGPWAIPWPCAHEFYAISTRAYRPASTRDQAFAFLRALSKAPLLRWLHEAPEHLDALQSIIGSQIVGGAIHDARIAAICLSYGVTELWTADRDFARFAGMPPFKQLRIRNPLTD